MMRRVLLVLLLLASTAQAQINGERAFEAAFPYMEGLGAEDLTIISGKADVELRHVAGPFGFFDSTGTDISGLTRVCWAGQGQVPGCLESGQLEIRALPGASIGIDLPGATDATYTADHALGLFVDFGNDDDLNSFKLETSLVMPAVGGHMEFGDIRLPNTGGVQFKLLGGIVALDDASRLQIVRDDVVVQEVQGKDVSISFEGKPAIAPFQSDLVVLPFEDDSTASFSRASGAAAAAGLNLQRIDDLAADLEAAGEGKSGVGGETNIAEGAGDFETLLSEVLNGALLRIPLGENGTANLEEKFVFIRYQGLHIEAVGELLRWQGQGALVMNNASVAGAPELVGFGFLQLPWWSFLLWGLALAALITRVALKAPKQNPTWQRHNWIGWVFGGLSLLLVLWLWDLEVRAVWGTSLLTTDAKGAALAVTAAVQLVPLLFVFFAVAAPLRMLMRNGTMLGRQGTFMGLSGGLAYLLAYAFGATLLLSYLELVLVQVLESSGA